MPSKLTAALILGIWLSFTAATPAGTEGSPVPYQVRFSLQGEASASLRETLRSVSAAAARAKKTPETRSRLESLAREDTARINKALRALGYYAATTRYRLRERRGRLALTYSIATGPAFLIDSVNIRTEGPPLPAEVAVPSVGEIGLSRGDPGRAEVILGAGEKLLAALRTQGYPFAALDERRVVVDYKTRSLDIAFNLDPGRRAVFGPLSLSGLGEVSPEFVGKRLPWREGDFYDSRLIQVFRNRLSRSGLFSLVLVEPVSSETAKEAGEAGSSELLRLPVKVTLEERKHRTLGLMAGYSTDLGVGGGFSWEDRNIFGEGESFRGSLTISEEMIIGDGRLNFPFFLHPDQSLTLSLQPVYDDPRAYTSYRIRGSTVIRRLVSETFSLSGGFALTQDSVEQLDETADFTLLSLPLSAQCSLGGQQPLTRAGAVLSLSAEPHQDLHTSRFFLKSLLNANFLYRFLRDPDLRTVVRVSAGSITESFPGEVPADLRFYAGGVNSIRGYSYQSVSPLVGKDPVGGRSLLTFSLELDLELLDNFGLAAFIDGGSAFAEALPQFNSEILWGTGAGLRYFSPIGPIGLDIGFPLNKRKGIDQDFQVYVSIAQIF